MVLCCGTQQTQWGRWGYKVIKNNDGWWKAAQTDYKMLSILSFSRLVFHWKISTMTHKAVSRMQMSNVSSKRQEISSISNLKFFYVVKMLINRCKHWVNCWARALMNHPPPPQKKVAHLCMTAFKVVLWNHWCPSVQGLHEHASDRTSISQFKDFYHSVHNGRQYLFSLSSSDRVWSDTAELKTFIWPMSWIPSASLLTLTHNATY